MKNIIIDVVVLLVSCIIVFIIGFIILKIKRRKKLDSIIEDLDREKNMLENMSIAAELSKLETIKKNDKIEEKYINWQNRYDSIKAEDMGRLNDMIIDLDISTSKKNYNEYMRKIAQIEVEISKAKLSSDTLLEEIKEITLSEEKYRSIIIKLKTKYRELNMSFNEHKTEYEDIAEVIELQFENIEKRFQDFEIVMEKNEYNEVVHIVKAIDNMVEHMGIVISEVPDLILLTKKLLPKRIDQINETYDSMVKQDYPLDYLKIPYNIEESVKNINNILDRIKVLNLEDCMFELKTMLEYLDSLFNEFDNEKLSRKKFEEDKISFEEKLEKTNTVVSDIYNQLDEIKNMYDLKDDDIKNIDEVNVNLISINKEYKTLLKDIKKKSKPYSEVEINLTDINNKLKKTEEDLDVSLKSLGNMYEDEVRAREQLDEIQELLKESKIKIRSYKLPIITNNYFVQLSEANEAILEIIKELERKPIEIKTLNTRVDTARDLVLKLYNTTNETIKSAKSAEMAIVYGNRFRSIVENIDEGLNNAEILFFKGNYKRSLDISIKTIEQIEPGFNKKIEGFYKKEI